MERVVDLWNREPAAIKGGIAGVVGLIALFAPVPEGFVENLFNTLGFLILLGDGLWIRGSVSPVEKE